MNGQENIIIVEREAQNERCALELRVKPSFPDDVSIAGSMYLGVRSSQFIP